MALLTTVRLDVRAAGQLARHAEAEALADGLTRLATLRLGDRVRRPLAALAMDGTPLICAHEDAVVDIAVTDVGGLVDLNTASQRLLEWLLRGLGLDADKAGAVAAAIVDFRDEDDVASRNGAESAAYRAAGLRHGPKNAPFETVMELDRVLGIDLALVARLRLVTTVHSRQPGIDPSKSSPEVLAVAAAAAIPTTADLLGRTQIPPEFRTSSRGRAYRVMVSVQLPSGGRFVREATIEPVRTAPPGFLLREWTASVSATAPSDLASASREPCLPALL